MKKRRRKTMKNLVKMMKKKVNLNPFFPELVMILK